MLVRKYSTNVINECRRAAKTAGGDFVDFPKLKDINTLLEEKLSVLRKTYNKKGGSSHHGRRMNKTSINTSCSVEYKRVLTSHDYKNTINLAFNSITTSNISSQSTKIVEALAPIEDGLEEALEFISSTMLRNAILQPLKVENFIKVFNVISSINRYEAIHDNFISKVVESKDQIAEGSVNKKSCKGIALLIFYLLVFHHIATETVIEILILMLSTFTEQQTNIQELITEFVVVLICKLSNIDFEINDSIVDMIRTLCTNIKVSKRLRICLFDARDALNI
jgi:hypothetical protein